tara:strand:- start:542 stop:958 length:417 start_codon:yes stop_codon:yes gene_type:complete
MRVVLEGQFRSIDIFTVLAGSGEDFSIAFRLLGGESLILDKIEKTTSSYGHLSDLPDFLKLAGLLESEVLSGVDFSPQPSAYEFRIGESWGYCKTPQLQKEVWKHFSTEVSPKIYPLFHIPPELGYKNEVFISGDQNV